MQCFVRKCLLGKSLRGLLWVVSIGFLSLTAANDRVEVIESWKKVLTDFVDEEGRTDFRGLSRSPYELNTFVAYLSDHGPDSEPAIYNSPEKALAFHLNAYNALAMHGVIDKGIPDAFDSILKRARFFKFRKIRVDGKRISLSAYENEIIRPFGDPRVHFALNCMVRDCPRLPQEAFQAHSLEAQLDAMSREFFNHPKHLRRMPDSEQVQVSKILDFYTVDFVASGNKRDLLSYINQFLDEPVPSNWQVNFMEYDWTVNQQP